MAVEDGMGYMEPPRLYQPVRHCLGRLLLSDGRPAEAEQVRPQRSWLCGPYQTLTGDTVMQALTGDDE